ELQRRDLGRVLPRLTQAMNARLGALADRLSALERIRQTLGYEATLARGFAVVRKGEKVVTSAAKARGDIEIEFRDGRVGAKAAPD
ncbi:MAG: exodeoxyribonuclease VII large subunit, partial [Silicimonas sp.]|nr:exodeoxyribonuclease VII large subunit [Silicimonas sp.]